MADNTRKDPKNWVSGDDPMTGSRNPTARPSPSRPTRPPAQGRADQGRGLRTVRQDAAKGRAGGVSRRIAETWYRVYANEIGNRKCLISFAPAMERGRSS